MGVHKNASIDCGKLSLETLVDSEAAAAGLRFPKIMRNIFIPLKKREGLQGRPLPKETVKIAERNFQSKAYFSFFPKEENRAASR